MGWFNGRVGRPLAYNNAAPSPSPAPKSTQITKKSTRRENIVAQPQPQQLPPIPPILPIPPIQTTDKTHKYYIFHTDTPIRQYANTPIRQYNRNTTETGLSIKYIPYQQTANHVHSIYPPISPCHQFSVLYFTHRPQRKRGENRVSIGPNCAAVLTLFYFVFIFYFLFFILYFLVSGFLGCHTHTDILLTSARTEKAGIKIRHCTKLHRDPQHHRDRTQLACPCPCPCPDTEGAGD